ncbi:hypothetical protein HS048_35185 [Planomonospora sp. ID91781]|uniref:DUF6283 family protein n=1 Tax=Planomonospora sp. ID91781 TaxID=2738135 RepID=UPI0018C3E8A4|nr:DUF6283 family protein [Planomonospora sp. ID91781]MBG0825920.1 hypothetical protein [Planomonospora sp. ID91781]
MPTSDHGADAISYRRSPCRSCPWTVRNAELYHYGAISAYLVGIGEHTALGADAVGCHASERTPVELCAGWLQVEGAEHPGVRDALADGRLPARALRPRADGPQLFSFRLEMLDAHAATSRRALTDEDGPGREGEE